MKRTARYYAESLYKHLNESAAADRNQITNEFASILYDNCQTNLVPSIEYYFDKIDLKKSGKIRGQTLSARSHGRILPDTIGNYQIIDEQGLDTSLIAGVKTEIAGTRIENSIRKRLRNLRQALQK
jgi:ATP synthase delta (OSCP) subunit